VLQEEVLRLRQEVASLRESEERYRSLVEGATDVIVVVAEDGVLRFANPAAARRLRMTPDTLVGRKLDELFPGEVAARHLAAVRRAISSGEVQLGDAESVVRDQHRWFRTAVVPLPTPVEGRSEALVIASDVTLLKNAELGLRLFRELIDHVHDAVFVLDDETQRISDVNVEACEHLGYSREELIGLTVADIDLRMRDPETRRSMVREVRTTGVTSFPGIHVRKDGSTYPAEVSARRVERGDRRYVVAIARDVSDRARFEQRMIRAERLAAVGTLASGIAHEFNNINVLVRGYCDLGLKREGVDEEVRSWLRRIRQASDRAGRITNDLLTLSRAGGAQQQRGDIVVVVREALALMEAELARSEVAVDLALDPVPETLLDRNLMGQVVVNLALNAIHAMLGSPERRLRVETASEGGRIRLSVCDTGCGIAQADLPRIFSPFFSTKGELSGDGAQAQVKGTGLGLSVSNTIVEEHDGEIVVDSEVGVGSRFTVWLPIPAFEA